MLQHASLSRLLTVATALLLLPGALKEVNPPRPAALWSSPPPSLLFFLCSPLSSSRWLPAGAPVWVSQSPVCSWPPPAVPPPPWPTLLSTTPGLPSPNSGWRDGPLKEVQHVDFLLAGLLWMQVKMRAGEKGWGWAGCHSCFSSEWANVGRR